MIAVLLSIFHTTAPWLMVSNFFMPKLNALPTANRKDGNTRSVGVNPCQAECSSWEKLGSPPGVLTMIMKQTVMPRKTSRASERFDATGVDPLISRTLKREIYRKLSKRYQYFIRTTVIERAVTTL